MGTDSISLNGISLNGTYSDSISNLDLNTYVTSSASSGISNASNQWITATGSGLSSNYSYITTNDLVYRTPASYLITILKFLGEKEISELLDTIITRGADNSDEVKNLIREVIRNRHFSEDFLLKYFEYVSIDDINIQHSSDILSHDYPALALAIEGKRDC